MIEQLIQGGIPYRIMRSNAGLENPVLSTLRENSRIREARGAHRRSLRSATPDFLLTLVALVHFMRRSLRKGAHAGLSSAAWQEIRVRSGRDDNSSWKLYLASPNRIVIPQGAPAPIDNLSTGRLAVA
jgi:hypothetical protein